MQSSDLLEAIWRGDIACAEDSDGGARLGAILDALVPMRRIGLARGGPGAGVQILPEQTELLPALALGDVIEEELAVEAPQGALVMILDQAALRPGAGNAARAGLAGRLVGELLIDAVQRGLFPIEHETEALYLMAQGYDALAHSPEMARLGLMPAPFRIGLATALASLWTGAVVRGSEPDALLCGPQFLNSPRLRDYLCALDASFVPPAAGCATADLVRFAPEARTHDAWLREIGERVDAVLRHARSAQDETAREG